MISKSVLSAHKQTSSGNALKIQKLKDRRGYCYACDDREDIGIEHYAELPRRKKEIV